MARLSDKPSARPSSGKRRAAAPLSGRPVARAAASILLVDDHPPNLVALEAILEPLGERLVLASSGSEAVAQCEHEDFALILLDLQMPVLDGLATAALLKRLDRCQGVPIIILTANEPSRDTVAKGYASGAVDFLYKPLDPDVIRSKVGVFVDLWEQRHRRQSSVPSAPRIATPVRRAELAELELRASEARTRLVLESAGLGTFEHNPVTGTLVWDARARTMFGVGPDDPICESTFIERVHKRDRARVASYTRQALDPRSDGDYDIELRTTEERWVAVRGQAFVESGRTVRFVGTLLDITARKLVEQERIALLAREQEARAEAERATVRAEQASRAKDEFLATVSHELRNPLNAILGWTRVLIEDERLSPERRQKGLDVILRNTKAQVQLVEDILDVSRIVNGKLRLTTRQTDVRAVAEAALETVRSAANAKGLVLTLVASSDSGTILADEDRIQQILWNLLSNAVKFTPAGGTVLLEARREEHEVVFSVNDTGQGIEEGFLPFVFDRFRQADGTTTREHGGLGLGLAIVRHLAELHGGTVHAASGGQGLGSTISVRLPLRTLQVIDDDEAPARSSVISSNTNMAAGGRLAGFHVLVLDDDEDMRDLIAMILEDAGARVTRASNVADALAAILRDRPHVAVSDLAMPGEDGYGFVRRIRAADEPAIRALPLVAMTAYARAEDRHRVLDAGFQRHIAKPIEPAELVETLAQMLSEVPSESNTDD